MDWNITANNFRAAHWTLLSS